MKNIKSGDRGYAVSDIQRRLKKLGFKELDNDGIFGSLTSEAVAKFQQDRGLLVSGFVDDETWQDIVEASYSVGERSIYLKSPFIQGDDVRTLQIWLRTLGFDPGPIDGIFGPQTEKALKIFQKNMELDNDGILSSETIKTFLNLRTVLDQNADIELPKKDITHDSSIDDISKLRIIIDFGHGGVDTGATGYSGLKESEINEKIGLKVANLLKMLGAQVIYSKKPGKSKSIKDRIKLANRLDYPYLISIHLNHSANPKAEGSSCYYFAKGNISSKEGKILASSIQKELVLALGSKDCRIHGKSFNILRQTKATTVMVEPCFITNSNEESLLANDRYLQKIAYAIFDGIRKYLKEKALLKS
jgi:N-acetylmuramoyl-L-alanine amidase